MNSFRYFSNGACRFGDACNFSHDNSKKVAIVCRYFLMGNCSFGDRCFYVHNAQMPVRPNEHHPPQPIAGATYQQMDNNWTNLLFYLVNKFARILGENKVC